MQYTKPAVNSLEQTITTLHHPFPLSILSPSPLQFPSLEQRIQTTTRRQPRKQPTTKPTPLTALLLIPPIRRIPLLHRLLVLHPLGRRALAVHARPALLGVALLRVALVVVLTAAAAVVVVVGAAVVAVGLLLVLLLAAEFGRGRGGGGFVHYCGLER